MKKKCFDDRQKRQMPPETTLHNKWDTKIIEIQNCGRTAKNLYLYLNMQQDHPWRSELFIIVLRRISDADQEQVSKNGESCFVFHMEALNFYDAADKCHELNGTMPIVNDLDTYNACLLYTSPSPRD